RGGRKARVREAVSPGAACWRRHGFDSTPPRVGCLAWQALDAGAIAGWHCDPLPDRGKRRLTSRRHNPDKLIEAFTRAIPLGRIGWPDDEWLKSCPFHTLALDRRGDRPREGALRCIEQVRSDASASAVNCRQTPFEKEKAHGLHRISPAQV